MPRVQGGVVFAQMSKVWSRPHWNGYPIGTVRLSNTGVRPWSLSATSKAPTGAQSDSPGQVAFPTRRRPGTRFQNDPSPAGAIPGRITRANVKSADLTPMERFLSFCALRAAVSLPVVTGRSSRLGPRAPAASRPQGFDRLRSTGSNPRTLRGRVSAPGNLRR